ncbi:Zn(2)-C6 fungal-type DNA-binding domain protein [Niveomyces insectorum RCEF 264]|uniref:Zn(2)-C6 fungal-type DNA-binding domain protein n=1 Tax=Niveomyces insectorum RCEF 264 TaxID=1081102 RepID=A0A162IEY7_9HYPO|nr:Zn(2)-C6 fungal-type DNA-binding domain protein [Niveomyces insectorum RCEF 264]
MSSRIPPPTNSTITVAGARPKNPCKLRQTCDSCSEAKVKCDKGNPRCGRCDRLSYECIYSPARRFGRPRPRSRRSPEQDGGKQRTRDSRDDADAVMTDVVTANKDNDVSAPALAPAAPVPPPPPPPPPSASGQVAHYTSAARHINLNLGKPLLDCHPDENCWSATDSANADSKDKCSDGNNSRSNNTLQSVSMNLRSDGLLRNPDQPSSFGVDDVQHNPYEYDCATVAVATLRKLAATGFDGQQSAPAPPMQTTAAADVLADHIPYACRQAARILVCPCSTDMDTALLTASLAAAILDVADAALRTLKPAGHALDDEQHTVVALGALPNISQVVTLFTHRYSVTQACRPPEALLLLAASLRSTLKALAEETTNRFLDSGTAPSSRRSGS